MIRFNIAIYNPDNRQIYISQLEVLLQSIFDLYKNTAKIAVFYNSVKSNDIKLIESKIPNIILKEVKFKFPLQHWAAQKLNLWYELLLDSEIKNQIFMDADMFLLKKIDKFFDDSFDIGYTHKTMKKEGLWKPLNTAVILVNYSEKVKNFMKFWRDKTNELLDLGKTSGGGWGAVDQQILGEVLGTKKIRKIRKTIVKHGIRLKGFPCKKLNNILSPSLNDNDLYIIHYKGSWRKILTEGNWKNSLRPDTKNDLELYNLWKTTLDRFKES